MNGKEIVIEGETYVDSRAVYELLGGLISDKSIRDLGKEWGRQKVGNRYFYRKTDVKLPSYPVARWQRMALMYLSLMRPEYPVMQFAEQGYYQAQAFLNGARVEKIATGELVCKFGKAFFVLLTIDVTARRYHLVVVNDTDIAGRQLTKEEAASAITVHHTQSADFHIWNLDLFAQIANELLAPMRGAR